MLIQLLIGATLICLTVIIEAGFIGAAIAFLKRRGPTLVPAGSPFRFAAVLSGTVLWLLLALTIAIWIWAGAFMLLSLFDTFETALYFSMVSFTTLGFGDVIIGKEWRLLSGMAAANGLILFSLTTAFLIEFLVRIGSSKTTSNAEDSN